MAWRTPRNVSTGLENGPISRSRSHGDSDVEKEGHQYQRQLKVEEDSDDDASSKYSSRAASASYQPMVTKAYTSKPTSSRMLKCSAGLMRYVCLGVAATILIFIFSLVRLSWNSDKHLSIAVEEAKSTPKPALWESFPFLERYYGGIRSLVDRSVNLPEYPRVEDEVAPTQANGTNVERASIRQSLVFQPYGDDTRVECFLDTAKTVRIPGVRIYQGVSKGFPDAVMGSNTMLGIRNDICYDRFGRLGPYGLGYSLNRGGSGAQQEGEREGADEVWRDFPEVDFRNVKWLEVQQQCNIDNKHRFVDLPEPRIDRFRAMQLGGTTHIQREEPPANVAESRVGRIDKLPRTAVIIRTWRDYHYTPEDLIYLRSLISELSLLSGGEYTLHFLIQVKDNDVPIWSDDETYDNYLRDSLPEEFRGMGTLWSERQMELMYGGLEETNMRDLPVHGVYRSTFMPMQYFAFQHPEFNYFWNWEMDIRYTGHWYHLFDSVRNWAKKQPRKLLWERNSRFYVPSEHGTWEQFSELVRFQTEKGTNSANNIWSGLKAAGVKVPGVDKPQAGDRPIWGPERPQDDDVALGTDPRPPTSFDKDKYDWGVGEEADLIVFNPLFDPDGTTWLLAEDTTGYNKTRGQPPRRTAIITASRLSRKLLLTMHKETALKRHTMFSEMWPATCALHHGLKAVYAPHSEYIDRKWPTNYLESVFNGGRNGATGASRTSVFGDREHNFRGTTWYYNAGFPEVLWHRWLGMRFNGAGGEAEEVNGEGRMCLPAMLLHPIKRVDLVQEGMRGG